MVLLLVFHSRRNRSAMYKGMAKGCIYLVVLPLKFESMHLQMPQDLGSSRKKEKINKRANIIEIILNENGELITIWLLIYY